LPPVHDLLPLAVIAFAAAVVNGALGYGFSSITVPLALLFIHGRALNPALVLAEVVLNAHVLWVNRAALGETWRRVLPVVVGLAPGIGLGTLVLTRVSPEWLKLCAFLGLLPLILLQAAGYRRPIHAERIAGVLFGTAVGALYAITTISGPPLAMFLIPGVAIGVPIGAWLIHRVPPEAFRRICMTFDAAIVAFGASKLLGDLSLAEPRSAYALFAGVVVIDAVLLYRYFAKPTQTARQCLQPETP
jgi:uncharacterized protein